MYKVLINDSDGVRNMIKYQTEQEAQDAFNKIATDCIENACDEYTGGINQDHFFFRFDNYSFYMRLVKP